MSETVRNVQLDALRKQLEAQLQDLLQRLQLGMSEEERRRLGPYNPNLLAYETLSELLGPATKERLSEELKTLSCIEASLCEFHLGMYGLCSDCEAQIPLELLEKDPTQQRCPECQHHHEESMANTQRTWL